MSFRSALEMFSGTAGHKTKVVDKTSTPTNRPLPNDPEIISPQISRTSSIRKEVETSLNSVAAAFEKFGGTAGLGRQTSARKLVDKTSTTSYRPLPNDPEISEFNITVTEVPRGVDKTVYNVSLLHKKTHEVVFNHEKKFSDIVGPLKSIKACHPKANLPAVPETSVFGANTVKVQERHKFLQSFMNHALADAAVCNNTEFLRICGFLDYINQTRSGVRDIASISPEGPAGRSGPASIISALSPSPKANTREVEDSFDDPFSPRKYPGLPSSQRKRLTERLISGANVLTNNFPARTRQRLIECFNLMDADQSGLVEIEELQTFVALMQKRPSSEETITLFKEADTEKLDGVDPMGFMWIIEKLCKMVKLTVDEIIGHYKKTKYQELFEILDADRSGTIERDEFEDLLVNINPLYVSPGVARLFINEADPDGSGGVDIDEFIHLLETLCEKYHIPLHELIISVQSYQSKRAGPPKGQSQQKSSTVTSSKMGEGSNTNRGVDTIASVKSELKASMINNENLQAQLAELKQDVAGKKSELDLLRGKVSEMEQKLKTMEQKHEEAIKRLEESHETETRELREVIQDLQEKLDEAETELMLERDNEQNVVIEDAPSNFVALLPHPFSQHKDILVLDTAEAVYYKFSQPNTQPLKLTMDVLAVPSPHTEYIVCRDSSGLRSLTASITNMQIRLGITQEVIPLKENQWVRVHFKFFWSRQALEASDGSETTLIKFQFRDAACQGVSSVDIYPRKEVFVMYANMRFLV